MYTNLTEKQELTVIAVLACVVALGVAFYYFVIRPDSEAQAQEVATQVAGSGSPTTIGNTTYIPLRDHTSSVRGPADPSIDWRKDAMLKLKEFEDQHPELNVIWWELDFISPHTTDYKDLSGMWVRHQPKTGQ